MAPDETQDLKRALPRLTFVVYELAVEEDKSARIEILARRWYPTANLLMRYVDLDDNGIKSDQNAFGTYFSTFAEEPAELQRLTS